MRVTGNIPSNVNGQTRLTYAGGTNNFISWGGVTRSGDCLVVPVAGWYKMGFAGGFSSNTTGSIRIFSIGTDVDPTGGTDAAGAYPGPLGDVNIVAHSADPVISTSGYGAGLSAFGIGYVPAANTKVAVWGRQDSGIALGSAVRFSIELIRTS